MAGLYLCHNYMIYEGMYAVSSMEGCSALAANGFYCKQSAPQKFMGQNQLLPLVYFDSTLGSGAAGSGPDE